MFKLWTIITYSTLVFTSVFTEDFLVLNCPDALQFEASTTILRLGQLKYVYNAVVGASATGVSTFSAFKIKNVFKLPHLGFLMVVKTEKAENDYADLAPVAVYPVQGRKPINNLLAYDANKIDYSLDNLTKEKKYTNLESQLMELNFTEAKLLVQELRDLLSTDKAKLIKVQLKKHKFISIHLDQKPNVLEFGRFKDSMNKLKTILKDYFFGALVYGPDNANNGTVNDKTITVIDGTELEHFNISPTYDEDYAAIFNIILWFSVGFSLALLAGIMSLINMDPGRDSIIYRMTAGRSKKDI